MARAVTMKALDYVGRLEKGQPVPVRELMEVFDHHPGHGDTLADRLIPMLSFGARLRLLYDGRRKVACYQIERRNA